MVCGFVGYEETSPHHSQIDPDTVWMCLGLTTSIFWMCTPILLSPAVGGLKWLDGCRFMMNDQLFKTAILDTTNIYKHLQTYFDMSISYIYLYLLYFYFTSSTWDILGWSKLGGRKAEKTQREIFAVSELPEYHIGLVHTLNYILYVYMYIILYS